MMSIENKISTEKKDLFKLVTINSLIIIGAIAYSHFYVESHVSKAGSATGRYNTNRIDKSYRTNSINR